MRHYEIVILVHPDRSEQVPAMMKRYREMVESGGGLIHRTEDWGRRRLAYGINDIHKAHYVLFNFECSLGVLEEIKRNFKFNDSILRHLVIRRKRAITDESPLAKAKAEEERLEEEKRQAEANAEQSDQEKALAEATSGESETSVDEKESDVQEQVTRDESTTDGSTTNEGAN